MLYDEEGKAYIEPPLIPEEQNLLYIVKDYRRMYGEYWKIKNHAEKLGVTNTKISNQNFALRGINQELRNVVRHCLKWMKKKGIEPSPFLENYIKENRL